MRVTESPLEVNDKTFQLLLKEPFGLVVEALAKPSSNVPFILPARVAATPPDEQIKETIGSGPFIFVKEEWQPGHRVVYVRNPNYLSRPGASDRSGGGEARLSRARRVAVYSSPRHLQRRAYRSHVKGLVPFAAPVLWNVWLDKN